MQLFHEALQHVTDLPEGCFSAVQMLASRCHVQPTTSRQQHGDIASSDGESNIL